MFITIKIVSKVNKCGQKKKKNRKREAENVDAEPKRSHGHIVTIWLALKHAFSHVHLLFIFFFFFFFLLRVNSNITWVYCSRTVYHCSCTVYLLKNIKNGSHDTIYTFKNYFVIVFSVFSFQFSAIINSIQTHLLSDNLRGKKPHVPRFLSHVMFNQPFCDTHLFNFYLFLLQ